MSQQENESRIWTEVSYTLSPKMTPQGACVAVSGKACAIRSDGESFFAMYDLPWIYPEAFDWTKEAKARLDTFLECACSLHGGPCVYHRGLIAQWMQDDQLRNNIKISDIPKALRGHLGPPEQDDERPRIIRPS